MTNKTDLKRTLDAYQARRGRFRITEVPDPRYLMVDGHGDPNTSPAFTEAIEALYPVAYKVSFSDLKDRACSSEVCTWPVRFRPRRRRRDSLPRPQHRVWRCHGLR